MYKIPASASSLSRINRDGIKADAGGALNLLDFKVQKVIDQAFPETERS